MITKNRRKKKKTSNRGVKVSYNCLKCKRFPLGQNLVSISTRTRHRKKYPQNINIQGSNINERESSDENIQSQRSSDIEILDIEPFSDYESIFQESSDKYVIIYFKH